MQLTQLEYFVAIADAGSLNKAAEKLFITQPTLSKAIANLEEELGMHLFIRSKNGMELTENGQKMYQYSRDVLERMDMIHKLGTQARELPEMLTVASYPIISMGKWISEFYNIHKEPYIHIRLIECRAMQAMEMVESREADIGFMMFNEKQTREIMHTLRTRKLDFHPLGTDTWYANVGPSHPLYDKEETNMHELSQYPCVRMPDDYFSNLTFYLKIDDMMLTQIKKVIHVNDTGAILSILLHTDAFRFGPGLSSEDYLRYGIRSIPIKNCHVQIQTGWIGRRNQTYSKEVTELIRLFENKCAEHFGYSEKE